MKSACSGRAFAQEETGVEVGDALRHTGSIAESIEAFSIRFLCSPSMREARLPLLVQQPIRRAVRRRRFVGAAADTVPCAAAVSALRRWAPRRPWCERAPGAPVGRRYRPPVPASSGAVPPAQAQPRPRDPRRAETHGTRAPSLRARLSQDADVRWALGITTPYCVTRGDSCLGGFGSGAAAQQHNAVCMG